ncbi:MAG: UDP-galactopyranose mutase [Clostridia bacterium]|nr:UDP-galactopyranose mutase [Clostridia bacterium]
MEKIIIVGAGLSGATAARLFAENGYDVTVIDKRENIGGNAYDYVDKNGFVIQPYGPHIFHTDKKEVFEFLSKFTDWRKYEHKVLAKVRKDKLVPVPFNLTALRQLFSAEKAEKIENLLREEFGDGKGISILDLIKTTNPELKEFATYVYKNIFFIYSMKQWGIKPENLDCSVMNRVPVYLTEEDRYFTDEYQFMPKDGFHEMVSNILRHPRIKLKLKTDANNVIALADGKIYVKGKEFDGTLIYTGCVDELFGYKHGVLPYRSLKFKFETKKCSSYQRAAVVNYTVSNKYTRITEFSKFTCEPKDNTVVVKEYAKPYKRNKNIPYYPIPTEKNHLTHALYEKEAKNYKNLYLLGRLATYKYINMDVAVMNAIKLYESVTGEELDLEFIKETKKGSN